ncbi:hypothetical protein ACQW02_22340 [Humitalea sp. 24SJ18S-53]|uniref:hypothetical protein n=1 Tax=Humitalea sp. 24SJ18S-53 TaxID=3422307 RepID=UPI003D6643B5
MRLLGLGLFLLATLGPAALAQQPAGKPEPPSFDCQRARAWDEQAICGDNTLAALDRRIAAAFAAARDANPARRDALAAEQRTWLRERGGCNKPAGRETPQACLSRVMTARAGVLEAGAVPPAAQAAPARGGCATPGGWAERTICANPNLLALDQEIARLATQAAGLRGTPPPSAIRTGYLARRDACERPVGTMPMDCLDDLLHDTRDALRAATGSARPG